MEEGETEVTEEGDLIIEEDLTEMIEKVKSPVKDFKKWLMKRNSIRRWKVIGKNVVTRRLVRIPDSKFMCLET